MPPGKSENLRARRTWATSFARPFEHKGTKFMRTHQICKAISTISYHREETDAKHFPKRAAPAFSISSRFPFSVGNGFAVAPKNKFFIIFSRLYHDLAQDSNTLHQINNLCEISEGISPYPFTTFITSNKKAHK